ncbi:hypothetical protein, partial [Phascolarctobacterium succinatutens]
GMLFLAATFFVFELSFLLRINCISLSKLLKQIIICSTKIFYNHLVRLFQQAQAKSLLLAPLFQVIFS